MISSTARRLRPPSSRCRQQRRLHVVEHPENLATSDNLLKLMAHGVPPSRLMLELRTQHNDFPHLAYDLIPPPSLFTLYPLCPRPEMCINPVGTLIKHGWSIYRRPKMSESHYSPYVTTPSGTRQTSTTVPRSPTLHHSRCAPPPHPNPSFACSTPLAPACDLFVLVLVLPSPSKLQRFPRDPGITGPPGEHLPYWDQIPYISL